MTPMRHPLLMRAPLSLLQLLPLLLLLLLSSRRLRTLPLAAGAAAC